MKQTTKKNKVMKPKFRADLVKQYIKDNSLSYEKFYNLIIEKQGLDVHIENSTFRQYFTGAIQDISIDVLKAMANQIGVTLDYFCYNDDVNIIDTETQNKLGLTAETANNLIENKPNRWLFNADKRPKDINKKDYTAILNLFLEKKIKSGIGKKSAIDVFTANVLNLFICTVVYDKTILETFKDNFTNLSSTINAYKTKPVGKTDIDMTFNEIFNSPTIQNTYRNATHELHDTVDQLLEMALKECFDSINPNNTLI